MFRRAPVVIAGVVVALAACGESQEGRSKRSQVVGEGQVLVTLELPGMD